MALTRSRGRGSPPHNALTTGSRSRAGTVATAVDSAASVAGSAAGVAGAAAGAAGQAVEAAARTAQAGAVPRGIALARGRPALAVAVAGAVGFAAIFAAVRAHRSEAIDLAITLRLQRRRRPWLDKVMTVASWPGFPPQSRLIPPVAIGSLWATRFRTEAAFETMAWGTALLSTALKGLMNRPRPVAGTDLRVVVAPLGGSSFPSGHVITFVGVYGFLAYLAATLIRDPVARTAATGGLVGLVVLVGPSRIYQGHHWPTDVSASYLLGTSYLIGVVALYQRLKPVEHEVAATVAAQVPVPGTAG